MNTPIHHDRALVVLSGGQDSTTCLFWAKRQFSEVWALTFEYGQRHGTELEAARIVAAEAGAHFEVMHLPFIAELSSNALTDPKVEVDEQAPSAGTPNTFVPGRNLFFLSIAAVYALQHGINNIVTGVSETDYSGYPDCRDAFIKSLGVTLDLAMDTQLILHTPLMWLDKSQTWALADKLGVLPLVRKSTVTCYNGIAGDGCGHCPACHLRQKGLEQYLKQKENQQNANI